MSAADAGAWFAKAKGDLLSIENNISAERVPWDVVTYNAQQAAEKYLKGFLVSKGVVPPKIHDLARLLDLCLHHDPALDRLRTDCIDLTDAGFRSRYPGLSDDPDERDARSAVAMCHRICDAVRERLSSTA